MTSAAVGGVPYKVPREPHPASSLLMAVAVHAVLLGFLWIGVSWQNTEPMAVEAEVWDVKTEAAAAPPLPVPVPVAKPEPVKPTPRPEPVPEPKVVPRVEPKPEPKVVEQPPAPKAPDIALERQKEQKEQKKKLLEKKLAEEKLQKEREREKVQELADQKALELAEKKAKEKADKLAKAAQEKAEKAEADKRHANEMKRITGALGSTGAAAKSTAPRSDPNYKSAIAAKIKSASRYAGDKDVPGDPAVEFRIEQLPTGEIISVRKTKSSGIPAYDEAIERAINNSSPLPKRKDGTVERSLLISFKMKDFSDAN